MQRVIEALAEERELAQALLGTIDEHFGIRTNADPIELVGSADHLLLDFAQELRDRLGLLTDDE
ncbi:MAG: hypothetical protein JWM06_1678 [Actinomycetia bacterium]|jgi:hypothetical protein|nr:hypothetical protein [Actinomycetes bacterium]